MAWRGRDRYVELVSHTSKLGPAAYEVAEAMCGQLLDTGYSTVVSNTWSGGYVRGLVDGRIEVLIYQMSVKFGILPVDRIDQIRAADLPLLLTWTSRVITAATVDEVFR